MHVCGTLRASLMTRALREWRLAAGKKGLKRYKALMLRRINWTESIEGTEQTEEEAANSCQLVWEGSVQAPTFEGFAVVQVTPLHPLSRLGLQPCNAVVCGAFYEALIHLFIIQ